MDILCDIAGKILAANPDPAIRVRLLRDVLHSSPKDWELHQAKHQLNESGWVAQLSREQRQDGSWGRFHSADSKQKTIIPTTEFGVARALSLGLDHTHPILQKAIDYLVCLLEGQIEFPDRAEKNVRWPTGIRLFTAATLALVQPQNPALNHSLEIWTAIAEKTFASGKYDPKAEELAHSQLTGVSVKNSYLALHNKYQLILLGSRPELLSPKTEKSLLSWLWSRPSGIGYLGMLLAPLRHSVTSTQIELWFASLEIVSQFSSWQQHVEKIIRWLWKQADKDGLWDFGPRASHTAFLPLSENWQQKRNRQFDWTTRTLLLMEKYYQ
ncbi:MAG: hypothetical protein AB1649_19355 [Chloroflexota bacterium]